MDWFVLSALVLAVVIALSWGIEHFTGLSPKDRCVQIWLVGAVLCGAIAWTTGRGAIRWMLMGVLFTPLIVGPTLVIDFVIRESRAKRTVKTQAESSAAPPRRGPTALPCPASGRSSSTQILPIRDIYHWCPRGCYRSSLPS